jgi:hypothetical protein
VVWTCTTYGRKRNACKIQFGKPLFHLTWSGPVQRIEEKEMHAKYSLASAVWKETIEGCFLLGLLNHASYTAQLDTARKDGCEL